MFRAFLVAGTFLVTGLVPALAQDTGLVPALAQDEVGDGAVVPVVSAPVYVTVSPAEPLALYVKDVKRDVASVAVLVQTTDGWVQMTPCDNVDVACADVSVESEGVEAGDVFYLGGE